MFATSANSWFNLACHSPYNKPSTKLGWTSSLNVGNIISICSPTKSLQVIANVKDPNKINESTTQLSSIKEVLENEEEIYFRQEFSIRSYEIGADRTVSIETLMNHFQEASINHIKSFELPIDGFGWTPEMCKRNLIWVIARMQVLIDHYSTWEDIVQVDTWLSSPRKHGVHRNWLVRDNKTGEILARASSVVLIMNRHTRKLCRLPDELQTELSPFISKTTPIIDQDTKITKLDDDTADYICKGLHSKWSDLDVNQHVNNVKYIGWMLESIPPSILESHKITSMTIEYRRECGRDNMLQSLTAINSGVNDTGLLECQHLLQLEDGIEIVRGRTKWKPKNTTSDGNGSSSY